MSSSVKALHANIPSEGISVNSIENLPFPSFLCNENLDVISVNQAMTNLLGVNAHGDMQITSLGQIESLLGARLHPQNYHNSSNKGGLVSFTNLRGEMRYCTVSMMPLDLKDGSVFMYILQDESRTYLLGERLARKDSELSIFSQVVSALGSLLNFDEILQIILIAITAREGLGFNRAFLFLYDQDKAQLEGYTGIGPSSPEEAGRIWNSLPDEGRSLIEVLKTYSATINNSAESIAEKVKNIKIPLDAESHLLNQVVLHKAPRIISIDNCGCKSECEVCIAMEVDQFAAVPMVAGENVLGVITADNLITGRSIKERDLSQLQVFANQAAIAIERTRLYQSLSDYLKKLEKANINLRNAQEELLKIERVTLWSELTSDIAHELRNPASIIGGFAALICKSQDLPDNLKEQAKIIFDECSRLESALNTVLDFSKSFAQEKTGFCLLDVVRETCEIVLTKEVNRRIRIQDPEDKSCYVVEGRVDQIKFAYYTIMSMISERLSPSCTINIRFYSADTNHKAVFEIESPDSPKTDYLEEIANPSTGKVALRMSMAVEAIKYNGGNLGIESSAEGRTRIYVEWPYARR